MCSSPTSHRRSCDFPGTAAICYCPFNHANATPPARRAHAAVRWRKLKGEKEEEGAEEERRAQVPGGT